jgi:hypothetical protein
MNVFAPKDFDHIAPATVTGAASATSIEQTAANLAAQDKPARGLPIRWHLSLFGVGILVPVLVVAAIVAIHFASIERARYQQDALALARNIADDIDRELDSVIAMAQSVSVSPALQRGDFAAFDVYAREIQKFRGNFIIVRDLAGQQLVNTRLPHGAKLPISNDPEMRRAAGLAAETRLPVVSNLLVGAVVKSLVLVVNVPVLRDGEPIYIVNLTLTPEQILAVLATRGVPPEFISALVDSNDQIIARSIQPGMALFAQYGDE